MARYGSYGRRYEGALWEAGQSDISSIAFFDSNFEEGIVA